MKYLRTILFWSHLSVALAAGLIVAVMAFTGATLAFEPQLLAWAERDSARVEPPAPGAQRLSVDELLTRVRASRPSASVAAVTVSAEPSTALRVGAGREGGVHVDPYTGQVRDIAGQRWRSFLQTMIEWHRWLGTEGDGRAVGKAITGAANAGFLFLALSGLYLWWPRKWNRRALRNVVWFRRGLGGKARDFNWHNTIGFWSLPVLIVVTASGLMISYRWASNLIFTLAGEPPPPAAARGGAPVAAPPGPPGAPPMPLEGLLDVARREVPSWRTITVRLGRPNLAQSTVLTVKPSGGWPLFASTQLSLHPITGKVLRKESYADQTRGRRVRSWLRFLHTGEALGWPGQLAAGAASLGTTLLVWTGFALAWRRLFRRKPRVAVEVAAANQPRISG